jgi:Ras family protein T1
MALNRIFRLFDRDNDLFLSERELGNFMKAAFGAPLPAHQMAALRAALRQQSAKCLRNGRLSFDGFCLLLRGVIETRMVEQVWTMLERFGYTRALTLRENYVPFLAAVRARAFDQTCELREEGVRFLTSVFHKFDQDQDGALSSATPPRDAPRHPSLVGRSELDEALLPCPESPLPLIYPQIVPVNKQGMVTLDGWLSLWSMLLCVNAPFAVLSLVHVGLPPESVESAVVINASKRDEEGLKRIERRCVFGLVMGLRGSGKSALMGALVERPFRKPFQGAFADGLTVAARLEGGAVLVLRELPDSKELVDRALEPEGEAARADIVLLVYDGSSKGSFDYVNALIPRLPDHIPALLVHAKADLSQFFPADSVFGRQRAGGSGAVDYALSYEIATEPVSAAADSPSDLRGFFRTVHANALRPDAFRPLSPARVKRQRTWWLVRALGVAAVAAASGVVSYVYVTQVRRAGAAEAAALGQDASAASGAANAAAAAGAAAATPTGGGGLFGRLRLRRA